MSTTVYIAIGVYGGLLLVFTTVCSVFWYRRIPCDHKKLRRGMVITCVVLSPLWPIVFVFTVTSFVYLKIKIRRQMSQLTSQVMERAAERILEEYRQRHNIPEEDFITLRHLDDLDNESLHQIYVNTFSRVFEEFLGLEVSDQVNVLKPPKLMLSAEPRLVVSYGHVTKCTICYALVCLHNNEDKPPVETSSIKGLDMDDQDTCITKCDHVFHYQCLRKWMESRLNCPLCRTAQNMEDCSLIHASHHINSGMISEACTLAGDAIDLDETTKSSNQDSASVVSVRDDTNNSHASSQSISSTINELVLTVPAAGSTQLHCAL